MLARSATVAGIAVNWAGSGTTTPSLMQLELIDRLRPTIWTGMSSYGLHLANLAEARGLDLAASAVETVLCSAEALSDAKRAKLVKQWGARVRDTFGMTEAGMMGAECTAGDGFRIWSDMFLIEVLDDQFRAPVPQGEVGNLVVTPLWTNNVTPFLRWSSGDLVTWREGDDATSAFSVFPLVKHAHRTAGFFKVRGINLNHSEFEDYMFRIAEIGDFKVEVVSARARGAARLDRGAPRRERPRCGREPATLDPRHFRAHSRNRDPRDRHAGQGIRSKREDAALPGSPLRWRI
jgi:phenylacetate-CoA ligase